MASSGSRSAAMRYLALALGLATALIFLNLAVSRWLAESVFHSSPLAEYRLRTAALYGVGGHLRSGGSTRSTSGSGPRRVMRGAVVLLARRRFEIALYWTVILVAVALDLLLIRALA